MNTDNMKRIRTALAIYGGFKIAEKIAYRYLDKHGDELARRIGNELAEWMLRRPNVDSRPTITIDCRF
jgi:hypothetical protein